MALKTYNPTSPGRRQLVTVDRSGLWKGKPVKSLTEGLSKTGGRNNTGRITANHRGGGHKRSYRRVDFKRTKFDVPAVVERIEYDPNRSAFIALVRYEDGELSYIVAPQRVDVGDRVISGNQVDIKPGNALMYYPEANVLVSREVDPQSKTLTSQKTPAHTSTTSAVTTPVARRPPRTPRPVGFPISCHGTKDSLPRHKFPPDSPKRSSSHTHPPLRLVHHPLHLPTQPLGNRERAHTDTTANDATSAHTQQHG